MRIVEFLEARLDEDQAVATAAGNRASDWRSHNGNVSGGGKPYVDDWSDDEPSTQYDGEVTIVYDEGWPEDVEAAHIARHDPARVLREVAAKRGLVELALYANWVDSVRLIGDSILTEIAMVYSDHPDFNEEWGP